MLTLLFVLITRKLYAEPYPYRGIYQQKQVLLKTFNSCPAFNQFLISPLELSFSLYKYIYHNHYIVLVSGRKTKLKFKITGQQMFYPMIKHFIYACQCCYGPN